MTDRLQKFEELLEKYAGMFGFRGFLFLDGTFRDLDEHNAQLHTDWVAAETMSDMDVMDYCDQFGAIRVWGYGKELNVQAPQWTQAHLDAVWKLIMRYPRKWNRILVDVGGGQRLYEGETWELPERIGELLAPQRAVSRVAAFEAMLKKHAEFAGMRGFLYPDGSWASLDELGVDSHGEFVQELVLKETGALEWIKQHPIPGGKWTGPAGISWELGVLRSRPGGMEYLSQLVAETDMDYQRLSAITEPSPYDWYMEKTKSIRIWGEGDTLVAETPHWNQNRLDLIWKFITENIEREGWSQAIVGSKYDSWEGPIWDLPEKAEDLFRKGVGDKYRVAAFEEMLKKHALSLPGLRGWLYLDGSFETLDSMGVEYHVDFAKKRIMDNSGALEWARANPPPDMDMEFAGKSDQEIIWDVYATWAANLSPESEWKKWLSRLLDETGLDTEIFQIMKRGHGMDEYYCRKFKAIRVWGVRGILELQSDRWTQQHLDAVWDFIMKYFKQFNWKGFELEDWDDTSIDGEIMQFPTTMSELKDSIRQHRVASLREFIRKLAFGGDRGFIDNNTGEFVSLDTRGVGLHEDFAIEAELDQSGAKGWIQNNPRPNAEPWTFAPPPALEELLEAEREARAGSQETRQWIESLLSATGLDQQTLNDIFEDLFLGKWCAKNDMTRVWISGDQLIGQHPNWTQRALDNFWNWALPYIEKKKVTRYSIGDWSGNSSRGQIWDMPERVEKLFRDERWKAASINIQYKRLVAEDSDWDQDKLNHLWKFATANIGNIKTFTVLDGAGRVCKGDIWDLPKKVDRLFV